MALLSLQIRYTIYMKVIKPTTFAPSMLISTTATNAHANWAVGTSYTLGQKVSYNGRIYESIAGGSHSGNQPDISPAFWVDIAPTNQRAMFDRTVFYGTTGTTSITVVVAPGVIDSIALINLVADLATVTIRDGIAGPIVYQQTIGLSGTNINDWYEYFFYDPLLRRTQVVLSDIPPYVNAHITLTITAATGEPVSLGEFIFGALSQVGQTQYGATSGIVDYSRKETDEFGGITFVERPFSKRLSAQVHLRNIELNRVQQLMFSLRATPAVWIASGDPVLEEALIVYGFYRDFSTEIAYPTHSLMSLEIEGLT